MSNIKSMKLYTHVERIENAFAGRERHQRAHGEATEQALDDFYSAVDYHLQSGKLGGLRLCAKRQE